MEYLKSVLLYLSDANLGNKVYENGTVQFLICTG